jgi:hypothetical protein
MRARRITPCPRRRRHRAGTVGFTLVELMVAVTGGLFIAIMVFVLARDGARFYNREARVADATLGAALGFERLRADIARAGYLSTPNVQQAFQRRRLCGSVNTDITRLAGLASIEIQPNTVEDGPFAVLNANGRSPDTIILSGAYGSVESFVFGEVRDNGGSGYTVFLQPHIGAAARLGLATATNATIASLFPAGRAVRLVSQTGEYQFGTISNSAMQAGVPAITLTADSNLPTALNPQSVPCRFAGTGMVNVVNFVRYRIGDLKGTDRARYSAIYDARNPWDAERTDLIRDELDTSNNVIAGTAEIVAEYAVDLKFGVTYVNGLSAQGDPATLQTILPGQNPQGLAALMAPAASSPGVRPQDARVIRARLSVRSREADRRAPVAAAPNVAPGLYRIGLGPNGTAPFARVRTQQADIALNNQMEI